MIAHGKGIPMASSSEAFSSDTRTIGGLLISNQPTRIVVPTFQRGYSWEKEHVKEFWEDVTGENKAQYFLGPIVIMHKPDNVIELLDGQQRLATSTILFSVLRDIAKTLDSTAANHFSAYIHRDFIIGENDIRRLQMGELDDSYFQETIQAPDPNPNREPTTRTHRNIKSARSFLFEMVTARLASKNAVDKLSELNKLKEIMRDNLVLTCITVGTDGNAFQIFETLNDRGLRLSIPDLLANYLMRKAPPEDRKLIRSSWDEMLTSMGKKYNIEKFIRHLWVSKYGDIKKNTFGVMKAKIEDKDHPIASLDFVRMCAAECRNYISIVSYSEEHLGAAASHVKALVQNFNSNAFLPMLLSARAVFDQGEFSTVVKYALVFMVRSSGLSNSDPSVAETVFYSLAREIRGVSPTDTRGKSSKLGEIKTKLRNASPSNDQIRASAEKMVLSEDCAEYIVRRLADIMETATKETGTRKEEANLEHIYPISPKENEWGGAAGQQILDPLLYHIGNLVMLGKRLNDDAENHEYPVKLPVYKRSELEAVKELVRDYPDHWDADTIKDRAKQLMDRVLTIWDFENPSKV